MKQYVKEYIGHEVPEGAAYYVPETDECYAGFYDDKKYALAYIVDGVVYPHSRPAYPTNRTDLVELPLAEAKYIPEVEEECEISNFGGNWKWCKVKFIGDSLCVVVHRDYGEQHYYLRNVKFRPIKSDCDEFIDKALNTLGEENTLYPRNLMKLLYDAGCRFVNQ